MKLSEHFSSEEFTCKPYYIYHIKRPDMDLDFGYVGVSAEPKIRWQRHRQDCSKGIHHSKRLQRAWNKYNDLEFTIIAIGTKEYILNLEKQLRPRKNIGYNANIGGDLPPSNKGIKMSEEQKQKIAFANTGKTNSREHKEKAVATRRQKGSYLNGRLNPQSKKVLQIDRITKEIIATYESTRSASILTGFSQGNIASVCRGERKQANMFKWKYCYD